jgi:hypothetical protein
MASSSAFVSRARAEVRLEVVCIVGTLGYGVDSGGETIGAVRGVVVIGDVRARAVLGVRASAPGPGAGGGEYGARGVGPV